MTDLELDRILDTWGAPEVPASMRRGLVAALPPRRRTVFGFPLRWAVACAAAAIPVAVIGTSLADPEGRLGVQAQGSSDGVYVRMTARVTPPIAALRWRWKGSRFSIGSRDGAVRGTAALTDRIGQGQYGFDYSARPVAGGYLVEAGPVTQVVQDGGYAEVEVYRAGDERVYLRLDVASRPIFRQPALGDDELRLAEPKLFVNGVLVGEGRNRPRGSAVWVALPGRAGRYVVVLNARGNPKFAANGHVDGKVLEFQAGADRIRIQCVEPIATRARDVYVFEEPAFQNRDSGPAFGSTVP
jgi:hypothetical protein